MTQPSAGKKDVMLCIFFFLVAWFVVNGNSFMGKGRKRNHKWILSWFFILAFSINFLSQKEQLCGFFHVSSKYLSCSSYSHTGSSWSEHLCEFFHVSSNYLTCCICSHTGSSQMVFHLYVFSNVCSSYSDTKNSCHIGYTLMFHHQSFLPFWLVSMSWTVLNPYSEIESIKFIFRRTNMLYLA